MLYHYSCPIPFHLVDAAGILFYSHVFTLAHQAFEQFIVEQSPYSWDEWFQNPEWIVPIKHAEANYIRPLRTGELCRIGLEIVACSSSSFTLESTLNQQETLCCTVRTVHVFCHRKTQQKIPIPEQLTDYFQNQFAIKHSSL